MPSWGASPTLASSEMKLVVALQDLMHNEFKIFFFL